MSSIRVNQFVCPALAIITAIVALWGPWFTRTTSFTKVVIDSTLLEILRGRGMVEYTSMHMVWLWGIGVILVVLGAVVGIAARKRLTQAGAYLMLALPVWSLYNAFQGDTGVDAGWALYVTTGLTAFLLLLARSLPDEDTDTTPPSFSVGDQPTVG